jgi:septal ring factor EnvC (AmiA/AmiB activator)
VSEGATLVVAVLAVIFAPLVAYIAASRKLSGKIGTSEASDLWTESKNIRDDYRTRIDQANMRQAELEARVAKLESQNNDLTRENLQLRNRIDVLERENAELKEQIADLLKKLRDEREAD